MSYHIHERVGEHHWVQTGTFDSPLEARQFAQARFEETAGLVRVMDGPLMVGGFWVDSDGNPKEVSFGKGESKYQPLTLGVVVELISTLELNEILQIAAMALQIRGYSDVAFMVQSTQLIEGEEVCE